MRSLDELDRFIGGMVRRWAAKLTGGPQPAHLLEIRRAILNDIFSRIEPRGGGQYLFPFNQIAIRIHAPDAQACGLYEAAFGDSGSLEIDIRELLADAGAPVKDLVVTVNIDEGSGPPFQIEYLLRRRAPEAKAAARPAARLVVIRGQAEPRELRIERDRVNLGRMQEVSGESGGLRRRNDIAFDDQETTVSREHAYIVYEATIGKFRLNDGMSQRGTSIFRDGRRIDAPRGGRGVQLQSGDEIHLGNARVRFEME